MNILPVKFLKSSTIYNETNIKKQHLSQVPLNDSFSPSFSGEYTKTDFRDDLKESLKKITTQTGKPRFNDFSANFIAERMKTPQQAYLAEKLANLSDKDGARRLDSPLICSIAQTANDISEAKAKLQMVQYLFKVNDESDYYKFDKIDIVDIAKKTKLGTAALNLAKNLVNAKDTEGNHNFSQSTIYEALTHIKTHKDIYNSYFQINGGTSGLY